MSSANNKGLSQIEALIVLAILAIMIVAFIPGYHQHVREERRAEAQAALVALAAAMERQFVLHNSYCDLGGAGGADVCGAGPPAVNDTGAPNFFPGQVPFEGADKYYDLSIQQVSTSTFTLAATPIGGTDQAGDVCAELLLRHDGVKQAKDQSGALITLNGWSEAESTFGER